ncbi:UNVERIFIED_CONTAM: hypothetical protein Slati_2749200 [Sesamum latifolium]|uniref:Reverse transcriptase Ty1/copia-type domain-containing protein n=1 Tax=Sesamum latifolium TaxID=2727402 RepID=A0AAW2VWW0_9LAMI
MKEAYAVPDRHIRYAATKAFFGTKLTEGSSVQSHGVKMLSLVEKLENLKDGLNNDTYIDVILQSLPPSFDPFIVNYNMNGLGKSIHELINMLVQYEAMTHKSESTVLVGEASTSKAKGKGARRWKRKKGKETTVTSTASTGGAPAAPKRNDKGKVLERSRKLSKDEMVLRLGDGKAVATEAMGSLSLVVSNHVRIELKDCFMFQEKMTKKPFVEQSAIANGLLDLVRTDVCGPLSTPTRGGFSYFITFTDDHSWHGYVYLMRYKSKAFGRFKEYRLEVENQTSRKIKALRSDRGELPPSFWGYALKTAAKMLNIAPSKMVPQMPYEIWHGKPASYKYLRVWGSPAYVKRLVGDKLDSRSKQKIFVLKNVVFLEKGLSSDSRRDEVLIEESSKEPQHDSTTSFEPPVHTDGVPVLRRSIRESRVPERYGFMGLTSQLDNDPKMYGEAMSDIDSDKWLEAMKSEMDSMGSNQVWTLVDPPKGVRPVGCKWDYKRKLVADGEVTTFMARLVAKGYTQRPRVDFEETYSPVAMAKSIRILLAIAA